MKYYLTSNPIDEERKILNTKNGFVESLRANLQRFLKGLGISKTMILPHYQAIKDGVLDGKRIFPEITYPDSMGRCFYAINDGSYIYGDGKQELLLGEGYLIQDGTLSRITKDGESYRIL